MCSALFGVGCDAALRSPASFQFGLPLAGWGLVYYGTLAALLLLARFLGEAFEFEANFAALLLSLPAFFVSLFLAGMMLAGKTLQAQTCWKLLGFFTAGLVAAVLYQWVLRSPPIAIALAVIKVTEICLFFDYNC